MPGPQSRAGQSLSSTAGATMSPTISMVPAIPPSQSPELAVGEGGTTSATGLPNRVTRIGLFVLRTRSSNVKHLALNLEMAISSRESIRTRLGAVDHSQLFSSIN
jgi:hypothetical protein